MKYLQIFYILFQFNCFLCISEISHSKMYEKVFFQFPLIIWLVWNGSRVVHFLERPKAQNKCNAFEFCDIFSCCLKLVAFDAYWSKTSLEMKTDMINMIKVRMYLTIIHKIAKEECLLILNFVWLLKRDDRFLVVTDYLNIFFNFNHL